MSVPSKFRISNTDSFKSNTQFRSIEDHKKQIIYCYLEGLQHIYGGPIIKFKIKGTTISDQQIRLSLFKFFFYSALIIIGYSFIKKGFENDLNDGLTPSVMILWLGFGFIFNLILDTKSLLEALRFHPIKAHYPNEIPLNVSKRFSKIVKGIKVRFIAGMILYLPLAAFLLPSLDSLFPKLKDITGLLYFFFFVGWFIYHDWALRFLRCPACDNLIFEERGKKNLFRKECAHCQYSIEV